jgi:DNA-binding LytR/AlgR family response regulator
MTLTEAQNLVNQIQYKPNFVLSFLRSPNWNGVELRVYARVPERDTLEEDSVLVRTVYSEHVLAAFKEEDFVDQIYKMIQRVELHEVAEFFKVKGVRVYDPHA